ncbi:dTDP-glucose 4,6-dehydratase [Roseateles sp. YR242]|uniref:NAD-dependent epimerase/dehydratase family protein n=1 Tax=Roseateles sp. YR242 TaxID=1855305 RepID=UPI0008C79D70|nr:NAD(P)-dependent oxidoreductase [Roseateles sp. YR242]SEK57274.1 dTDP-glucose 4,6-dehydratase [Roseateles sp. YR242]
MPESLTSALRSDCLASLALQPALAQRAAGHRIAIIGGTGFVGTWIAEIVAALNDEFRCGVRVDLLGRSAPAWRAAHPHLAGRDDIQLKTIDVRSSFELARDATLVLYAAGVADPRVHASDPFRVQETALQGLTHALAASTRLELLQRFVNVSSGLVAGTLPQQMQVQARGLKESDLGLLDFTRVHNVYAESRRAAESLTSLYASQYRIPVSTARAFTFIGPYQPLDAPWALNNFIRDALSGNDIRLHGDGNTRRSYLYGSDAAAWLLKILTEGRDGEVYNVGGNEPVSHSQVADLVAGLTVPTPQLVYKSQPAAGGRQHDFFPDLQHVEATLGLRQAVQTEAAIERAMHWHAHRVGVGRRLRPTIDAS